MSEYFETDTVTREYDSRLTRRILSYLKPCCSLVVLTLAALVISTLGELFIPVLQQRILDGAVLPRFFAFRTGGPEMGLLDSESRKALDALMRLPGGRRIENMVFVPQNQRVAIKGKTEEGLRNSGVMDPEQWYAFSYNGDDPAARVIKNHEALFLKGANIQTGKTGTERNFDNVLPVPRFHGTADSKTSAAAIRNADLYSLSRAEIAAIRRGDILTLIRGGILFLAALVLVFIFTFLQTWTANLMSQRVMKDIRLGLFKKTLSQSTAFLSRHPIGRIVTRLTGDVETIDEFFTTVLVAFLKDLSIMAGALVTLFILSPQMALLVFATLPPVAALTMISRVKARDAFRRQRTASSKVYAYLAERLAGIQVVQLFRREKKSGREFALRNRELLDARLGEMYVFAVFRPVVEWFSVFTAAVVIVAGSKLVLSLSVSLGVLIAFINLVQMFYSPVMDIAEKYTLLQSAMAGGERVFQLLDTDERIPDIGTQSISPRGHVEFDNVRFAYKAGEDVLQGLSFTVQPGEMTAIVGYTGAGKTTIINVLARLWDIDSGEIRLDGIPVREIPLGELRRSVLPVLQEVFLFSGTVKENISLGLEIADEAIIAAAKAVHAHEFISGLPQGYDTPLSEGAANISLGQRQLISFARVIAHNPRVVILDEATSSIDTETEHLIQLGMKRVLAGRTSFVIAHRLSTIRNASRILVLSGGQLAEQGTHEELIARGGLYAGLYRLQYAED
ncbi:MAG: ABC transporter ATP-binding protein/permease [Treponema sp.]|jgi:ATP-binding cassette subfamily B protein|nr:ABC transporter ATP-binding protein/permease [Treponema sp.]